MKKVPHAETISKLRKPADMYRGNWRNMLRLLRLLSSYGDDIWPTQRTLAKKLDLAVMTVNRLVQRAEAEGWIDREERPIEGHRPGTTYLIRLAQVPIPSTTLVPRRVLPSEVPVSSSTRKRGCLAPASPGPTRPSLAERMGRVRPNRYHGRCYVCALTLRPREGILHGHRPIHPECVRKSMDRKWQREQAADMNAGTVLGEDPHAPLPTHSPVITNPAARLAKHFEDQWYSFVLPKYPDWRQHRWGHVGAAIGYITTQFLRKGYSPAHVEAYFDAFFTDLVYPSSPLQVRDGQTAWQLFTGWWGQVPVPDPAIEQAKQGRRDAVRADMAEGLARQRAARDRVLAAQDQGLEPDPQDWRLAQGMA